jgi:hypothetical protein
MRLINIEKVVLEEFFGHQIPPYAILSHCWGKEELSFQDIAKSDKCSKHGFAKIDLACRQAKLEGFRHAWIDTCCIDKSSSVELSEAINSMYSWYAKAAACYVYLEDVTASAIPEETFSQFEKSRWFTRGWTLQELLAPQDVHFYDKNWKSIGTKRKLCRLVSKITQIPELVLQDRMHLKSIGVAQRMSWAANRQTTRLEDIAYCLLGLFDVNIPLLYGEGEKAFLRLQEEILRVSDDQSLFAWDSTNLTLFSSNYGFLAPSPAAFAFAGAIVPIPSVLGVHSFSMTNKGLCICLPLLLRKDEIIGLLNCRQRGDFSSIAGVPLLQTSNPSVFERDPRAFVKYFSSEEVAEATSHTIYISGNQPLYAPWEIYKTFILRRITGERDYSFTKAESILFDWEDDMAGDPYGVPIVRTVWEKALNRCRLAFGLYDRTKGHTLLVMLLVHLEDDGTFSHFTSAAVFLADKYALDDWNRLHFSTVSHHCDSCWGSSKDLGIKFKLVEQLMLNQKVIIVNVQKLSQEVKGVKVESSKDVLGDMEGKAAC